MTSTLPGLEAHAGRDVAERAGARMTMWTPERARTYHSWHDMVRRCRVPSRANFKFYGGRGITVCDRWADSFDAFVVDVGLRPAGLTLDRIENARGYEPGNVRWATHRTQCRNRRSSKLTIEQARIIRMRGMTETYRSLAREFGVSKTVVAHIVQGRKWREDAAA